MRLIGWLLVASIALAVLKVAVQIVALVTLGGAIWYAVTKPLETVAALFLFILTAAMAHFPVTGLLIFGCLGIVGLLGRIR